MPVQSLSLSPNVVGYIVRGKTSDQDSPSLGNQHSDCLLSSGQIVGFFGGAGSGCGMAGVLTKAFVGAGAGKVFYFTDFLAKRPQYVNIAQAKHRDLISTVLLINVTATQSTAFTQFWTDAHAGPMNFRMIGGNCSSIASRAFRHAGILTSQIPTLDTPDRLYRQLVNDASTAGSYSGYLGIIQSGGVYHVTVETTA